MHVTVLSRGTSVHTTRRLVEAAQALGHRTRVLDPMQLQMGLGTKGPQLFMNEKPLGKTDVVIPRVAPSIGEYGLAIVNQFDAAGVAVLNDAMAIAHSRAKMRLMQILARQGIPVAPMVIGRGAAQLKQMADVVGGFPVVIKIVRTDERPSLIVCESPQSMEAAAETVLSIGHDILMQRYVRPEQGRDLRALVVGGAVIAAIRRQPPTGKLRHSLSTGARVSKARLTKEQRAMAIESARVVGLEVAAVDMLALKDGTTQVFEVYSNPGLRDLEEATGEDLAVPIVQRALELGRQRKRLTAMSNGQVVKLPRTPAAALRGSNGHRGASKH